MASQVITIKIDAKTKKEAQSLAKELGLSLSGVLKGFLKHFLRTKTVTFSAQREKIPSEYFIKAIKKAEKNLKEGKHSPIFKTGEEAVAWLEKQGI